MLTLEVKIIIIETLYFHNIKRSILQRIGELMTLSENIIFGKSVDNNDSLYSSIQRWMRWVDGVYHYYFTR